MLGRRQCPADCARRASPSTAGARLPVPVPRAPRSATTTMMPGSAAAADRRRASPPPPTAAAATSSSSSSAATDTSGALLLGNVRSSLIRQEDTIIFNLIERAQFARNDAVYQPGAVPVPPLTGASASASSGNTNHNLPDPSQCSLLEYVLRETERLHGSVRRYTSPDEHAFYPDDLPPLVLPPLDYPSSALHPPAARAINANGRVLRAYLDVVLPLVASAGDDSNYGSAATLDVLCLQALSKRIHYGMFVAEAKFRAAPEQYGALIKAKDSDGIMKLLTDEAVERRVVERVTRKAAAFGQDISDGGGGGGAVAAAADADGGGSKTFKVRPDAFGELYDRIVMPMTKDVQVEYLLRRLDGVEG